MKHLSFVRTFLKFTLKRVWKGAVGMGFLYAVYGLSQSVGLVRAYPEALERTKLILSLKGSTGLDVMYGSGARLDGSIGAYMEWRVLGFGLVFAALWGIFVGTRLFRQDEETGRQEHVLARNTTPTRTFVLSLSVTMGAVVLQVVIAALSLLLANKTDGVHFGIAEVVLFSTTMLSASVLFIGFSSLFSQLFNTRRRALLWSGVLTIFCFGIRAFVATKNNATWATYVSPFDWMQNVHPLSGYRLAWFIPTVSLTAALLLTAGILNHKRDMGEGVLKSNDIARRRSRLLSSSLSSSMFFMRASIAIWGVSIIGFTMFLATLAHTAQDALKSSSGAFQERVSSVLQTQTDTVVRLFLGMAFFIATVLLLTAVAGFVIALKNEESQGYLDTILVRPQSRSRWLIERVSIIVAASAITAVLSGVAAYFVLPVGVDVPASELLKAGINCIFPAILLCGVGALVYAIKPSMVSVTTYGIIVWSLFIQIVVPILSPKSAFLKASLFHYVASVPAVAIDWVSSWTMFLLGVGSAVLAVLIFSRRDLQNE